jgi:uncharacterized integral membrane protein
MATDSTPQPGAGAAKQRRSSRETARLVAVAILAGAATLFAVLNLDKVRVHLLFGSPELPLIVVIVLCVLVGMVFGAVLAHRSRRR